VTSSLLSLLHGVGMVVGVDFLIESALRDAAVGGGESLVERK